MTDPILSDINRALAQSGMSRTAFGLACTGDPNLVPNIEAGRELRRSTREKVADLISKIAPTDCRSTDPTRLDKVKYRV